LDDPTTSPQARRHAEGELKSLEKWVENHPDDSRDPSSLELYSNENPNGLDCRMYED
jgi:hypothetical protein